MTIRLLGPAELTYGATRSIDRLTAAADAMRSVIMHEVPDQEARLAALSLVGEGLDTAVHGVAPSWQEVVVYRVALVVAEIVELMMTHDLKRVPVVRDRRLVGSRLGRIW